MTDTVYHTVSMYCGWVKHERDALHCSIYIILYPCTVGGWNTSEMPCTVLYISYCIHVLWVGETRARCLALFYIYHTVSMYCGWVKHERDALHRSIYSIIESVDSISRDERDAPLTQYITNAGISRAGYTIAHFKHDHRVLRLISNRMSV